MACHGSFPSCRGETHPEPKSDRDLDPDNPGCITFCRGDEVNPTRTFFWILVPAFLFETDLRVIESVIGSAPVEHPD